MSVVHIVQFQKRGGGKKERKEKEQERKEGKRDAFFVHGYICCAGQLIFSTIYFLIQ
jgi:hypothetical protein